MIQIVIPGREPLALAYLVLDVNGTLALDGQLLPGVAAQLGELRNQIAIRLLSADTYGTLAAVAMDLQVPMQRLEPEDQAAQKAAVVETLGAGQVVAIGNGANDMGMLRRAALGMAVLGPEALARDCLMAADVIVPSITVGLDLLLYPRRLAATLRI
jgi:P-type E1-E2 ATPase